MITWVRRKRIFLILKIFDTIPKMVYFMNWDITYYKTNSGKVPVIEYIKSLDAKNIVKIRNALRWLIEFGINESQLGSRKIKGKRYKGLYELKIDSSRIIYFLSTGRKFVLLHGFTKKTQKTPIKEFRIAETRMKDYIGG